MLFGTAVPLIPRSPVTGDRLENSTKYNSATGHR